MKSTICTVILMIGFSLIIQADNEELNTLNKKEKGGCSHYFLDKNLRVELVDKDSTKIYLKLKWNNKLRTNGNCDGEFVQLMLEKQLGFNTYDTLFYSVTSYAFNPDSTYTDTLIQRGKTYNYKLRRQLNGAGWEIMYSDTIKIPEKQNCSANFKNQNLNAEIPDSNQLQININWSNKLEKNIKCNSDSIIQKLERKENGDVFQQIIWPKRNDTTYLDTNVQIGNKYVYKLWRMHTQDSTSAQIIYSDTIRFLSEAVGLIKNEKTDVKLDIVVYPNPTNGQISIKSKESIQEVWAFDLQGKKQHISFNFQNETMQWSKDRETNLNINHLPVGVYFLRIKLSNGYLVNKKLIKQ